MTGAVVGALCVDALVLAESLARALTFIIIDAGRWVGGRHRESGMTSAPVRTLFIKAKLGASTIVPVSTLIVVFAQPLVLWIYFEAIVALALKRSRSVDASVVTATVLIMALVHVLAGVFVRQVVSRLALALIGSLEVVARSILAGR